MCILLVGKESQKKDVFSFKIPKNTQLLEPDSDDDDIGNERVNISKNKFSNAKHYKNGKFDPTEYGFAM